MNSTLELRELNENDDAAFLKGANEWPAADVSWYSFDWRPGVSFSDLLETLRKSKAGLDVPAHFVPSTMLYAFVEGEIVGRISIRHHLNDNLRKRGGHVGYAVAPRFRRRGYATEIMRQGLEYCRRSLGLTDVLVTCADINVASWKIIERFGGVLQDREPDRDAGELIRRYRIKL